MTPNNAAGLGTIMAVAAAMQSGYTPRPRKTTIPENQKRRDKTERNKRKQQKESRRRNRR